MFWEKGFVCRLCLLSDLDDDCFEKVFENDVTEMSCLASKILSALKWKICRDDGLPNFVCKECIQKLNFIIFCNIWSSKVALGFEELQSLFLLHSKQGDETARSILWSIYEKRNSSTINTALAHNKFDTITSLVVQAENLLSKIETKDSFFSKSDDSFSDGISFAPELPSLSSPVDLEHYSTSPAVEDESLLNAEAEVAGDLKLPSNSDDTLKRSEEQFLCPECPLSFAKKSLLWKHLLRHEGAPDKYQCSICTRKFISTSELSRHIRAHKGLKPYKCPKCDQFFNQRNLLDNHLNWHDGRKGHLCEICGECLSSGPNLKAHILNLHSTEKKRPFKCDQCGKSFARNHHLENHKIVHEESRPHQCTTCGVTFKRSSQLQEHENVHSGEKQFKCDECNKCFRTKRVLNVHKLVHSELKPFQCTQCTKSFVRRGGLLAHLKSHKN